MYFKAMTIKYVKFYKNNKIFKKQKLNVSIIYLQKKY